VTFEEKLSDKVKIFLKDFIENNGLKDKWRYLKVTFSNTQGKVIARKNKYYNCEG